MFALPHCSCAGGEGGNRLFAIPAVCFGGHTAGIDFLVPAITTACRRALSSLGSDGPGTAESTRPAFRKPAPPLPT
jgi:hypothetical protein